MKFIMKNEQAFVLKLILISVLFLLTKKNLLCQQADDTLIFKVETDKSQLFWRVQNHRGHVQLKDGTISVHQNQIVGAKMTILMDSLKNTDIDYDLMRSVFENTIKSREFMYTEKHPFSYFDFYSAKKIGKDSVLIQGNFTLRDITSCIQFRAKVGWEGETLKANTDTIILDRTKFGIFAMSKRFGISENSYEVSDSIRIQINLDAKKVRKSYD